MKTACEIVADSVFKVTNKLANENTLIYSELDSLAFVELMVDISFQVSQQTGKQINLLDKQYFLDKGNPYKTVGTIVSLVESILKDDNTPVAVVASVGNILKAVIVDLDGTLWAGVSGEDDIKLFDDRIKELHSLSKRGVYIGALTKNVEKNVSPVIKSSLPFMFAVRCCGVDDKAAGMADLLSRLNLTPIGVVYVDDDPMERDRIREAFPEIDVLPPEELVGLSNRAHDSGTIDRMKMLEEEYHRTASQRRFTSRTEWLRSLDTVLHIEKIDTLGGRPLELYNRSNQFNSNKTDPLALSSGDEIYIGNVKDKYGDLGTVMVAVVRGDTLERFALSCRAMRRDLEHAFLNSFGDRIKYMHYVPTDKNAGVAAMYGMIRKGERLETKEYIRVERYAV